MTVPSLEDAAIFDDRAADELAARLNRSSWAKDMAGRRSMPAARCDHEGCGRFRAKGERKCAQHAVEDLPF